MKRFVVTRIYYKEVIVEAETPEEAHDKVNFDDVKLYAKEPDEVQEI